MALLGAAAGAGWLAQPGASASTKAHHSSKETDRSKAPSPTPSGVPSIALVVGESFDWILPLHSVPADSTVPWDEQLQDEMWLPLYWAGKGSHTGINYTQSIGKPPVYSNHDQTVTITMKTDFKWSTGAAVTSSDIKFFFQLYDAAKKTLDNYLPGRMPDDITSVTYPNSSTFVLHLNHSYSPTWFTDNQLTWIYPLPVQEWDRTALTSPAGSAASTTAGARKVMTFLFSQSKDEPTYATNPLWKIVDGPFEIDAYSPVTHDATFATNPHYSGPTKPRIAGFKVYTFTTGTAELDALRSGTITFGWIPFGQFKVTAYFESHGYSVEPWPLFGNQVINLGYTSKRWGPLVKQLYIRQALQHVITENLYIKRAFGGYALPVYGPVADYPGSKFVSPSLRKDPYPYDPRAAANLLKAHGWASGPGGVDVCKHPGTGAHQCGKGIADNEKLSFLLIYVTGTTSYAATMSAFQTAAKSAGIGITLDPQTYTTTFSLTGVCPRRTPCNWGLSGFTGFWWTYSQYTVLPSGEDEFGAGSTYAGGYSTSTAQRLITATETHPGLGSLYKVQDYLSKDLASLWWPIQDFEIAVVKNSLGGWQHLSPYADEFNLQSWYVKKSG
jgi:peptide/nickel transport system substrate-binding protein